MRKLRKYFSPNKTNSSNASNEDNETRCKKKKKNKNNLRNRENHPKIGAGVFGDEHARMRKSSRK